MLSINQPKYAILQVAKNLMKLTLYFLIPNKIKTQLYLKIMNMTCPIFTSINLKEIWGLSPIYSSNNGEIKLQQLISKNTQTTIFFLPTFGLGQITLRCYLAEVWKLRNLSDIESSIFYCSFGRFSIGIGFCPKGFE